MFKKLQRQIDRKKAGSQALKYRFDLHLETLEGLPPSVTQCRVVWARGAKVQLSRLVTVRDGVAEFSQQLSQVATVFRTPQNQLEGKEYSLKVEVPTKGDANKMVTFGKAVVDIVQFVSFNSPPESTSVPIPFKVGSAKNGTLKFLVRATMLKGYVADDGMTEVSGMTGLSSLSASHDNEQDLSGFEDSHDSGLSGGGSTSGALSPPLEPLMDPIPEIPAVDVKRAGGTAKPQGNGVVKGVQEVAAVTVTAPKMDSKEASEISTLMAENTRLTEENAGLVSDLQSAESDIEKAKAKLKKYKEVKKENEELKLQVKRLERATEQGASSQEAEELKQEVQAARQRGEALERDNAELLERMQSLEQELEQEQGAGAETNKLKEIYDSRILGLKREVEEATKARAELEDNVMARVEEEVARAVDKEVARHAAEKEKIKAQVKEMQLRAGEDLDLLESRLLEANAENGRLEKREAEAKRESKRIMQEKLSLERELFSATDERAEMEQEIRSLKAMLAQGSGNVPQGELYALPISSRGAPGDDSSDSFVQDNSKPQASGADDQELMRVVAELALAKISMAEMSEEKIKLRRDLYKQKEKYMTVAAKMTKLETKLYGT